MDRSSTLRRRAARVAAAVVARVLLALILPSISGAAFGAPVITQPADGAIVGTSVTISGLRCSSLALISSHTASLYSSLN